MFSSSRRIVSARQLLHRSGGKSLAGFTLGRFPRGRSPGAAAGTNWPWPGRASTRSPSQTWTPRENVAITRKVVDSAHSLGLSVEGELGTIGANDSYAESEGAVTIIYTDPDDAVTFVAAWGAVVPVGTRQMLGGHNLATLVFETGRSARMDRYADASGPIGATILAAGIRSAVATPIIVEGRLWGVLAAASSLEQPLPPDAEVSVETHRSTANRGR